MEEQSSEEWRWRCSEARKRPGMYVGSNDGRGIAVLLLDLVKNRGVEQHVRGTCSRIDVAIEADGAFTVADDGLAPAAVRNCCEGAGYGLFFRGDGTLWIANAFAERFELVSRRDGIETRAVYSRGELIEPWTTAATTKPSGATVHVRPDRAIFTAPIDRARVEAQLDIFAYLLPGLVLGRPHDGQGLPALVAVRAGCAQSDVVHVRTRVDARLDADNDTFEVQAALAWRDGAAHVDSFVNFERTRDGGGHVEGLLDGVRLARGEPALDGLVAAIHVVIPLPRWAGATKDRLITDVREPVANALALALAH
jgi:DNA gyrase subunit B